MCRGLTVDVPVLELEEGDTVALWPNWHEISAIRCVNDEDDGVLIDFGDSLAGWFDAGDTVGVLAPGPLERSCPLCEWGQRDCQCPLSPRAEPWGHIRQLFERLRRLPPTEWEVVRYGMLMQEAVGVEYPSLGLTLESVPF